MSRVLFSSFCSGLAECLIRSPVLLLMCAFAFVAIPDEVCFAQQATGGAADSGQIVEENGMRYRMTRSKVMQPVRDYRYVDQPQVYYQQRYRTEFRPTTMTQFVPQTRYEVVPRLYDWWRVLGVYGQPYVAYGMEPRTSWVRQTQNVAVPVTRSEVVPYTRTVRTPVPYLRMVEREHVSRVALGPVGASQVAVPPQQLTPTYVRATPDPTVASRSPQPTYIPATSGIRPPIVATADPYGSGILSQANQPSAGQLAAPSLGRSRTVNGNTFQTHSSPATGPSVGAYRRFPGAYSTTGLNRGRYGGVARMDGDPPRYGTSTGAGTFQARR